MRPLNSNSAFYSPENVPSDIRDLPRYTQIELDRIKRVLDILIAGHVDTTYVAPTKPREGDLKLADGVEWDPGSGAGFYGYYGSAWHKLG